ncbi:MAG TPA: maltose alpha-D-glucosyltransferase [Burkholderiales bacterium]|nr:maltose alpha-D-glucosyltransferase [Burkholderiales bacterium]
MTGNKTPAPLADDPLWYKDAIIYELHVKTFFDSNNDGIGDFPGLLSRLDYLQDLGVNTLWLLPFYPSPMRDDGYDIADYRNIAPEYGTRSQFRAFLREAHRRGLRVITELVINHTSDQHPWFQAARRAPAGSVKRDYYVWSSTNKKYSGTRIIFTDTETSNWTWDTEAKAYFWHRFFSHQPDLNFDNPHVVRAVLRNMNFWFDMGVDGMRLDAIPYLIEREGTNNENLSETHAVIRDLRAKLDARYKNRMFLAEANQWPEDVREYFGDGDECHMAYHFPLMPRIYMAVAQEDRHPIVEIMRQTPDIPDNCQWAIFLRNHDELTLEMVTSRERDYLYQMYAADPQARINFGIRRRLAPLMDNDRQKIELVTFLLMSMPGSPIIYYGDEIGMGDNIYLGDRNSVRTPMQWSPDRNGGFSRVDPQRLYLPANMDASYGYQTVNVESQLRNPSSLLNWMRRAITVRKHHRALGRGSIQFLGAGNRKILAYVREFEDEIILCVANLSHTPQAVELNLAPYKGRVPVEVGGRTPFPPIGELPYFLTLPRYGYYGFHLATDVAVPSWHEERLASTELPVLVMLEGLRTFFMHNTGPANEVRRAIAGRTREQLQREVLGPYLSGKRWFGAKGSAIERIEIAEDGEWKHGDDSWLLAVIRVYCTGLDSQDYFMPMAIAWGDNDDERLRLLGAWTLAKVRQRERVGILYSGFGDDAFCRALVAAMGENLELPFAAGKLRFSSTPAYAGLAAAIDGEIHRPALEQSNLGVFFGSTLYLKSYLRMQPGLNPEIEMGRFLTQESPFSHAAPVAGALEYEREDGTVIALALLSGYVENQGSGWDYTIEYLRRSFEASVADGVPATMADEEQGSQHAGFLSLVGTLARRTAELHQALGRTTGDSAFDPEPITASDIEAWTRHTTDELALTLELLESRRDALPENLQAPAAQLLAARAVLDEYVASLLPATIDAAKTRYHGDYHLGQVLLAENDFVIVDFEGEPARPLAERRAKHSPLRDVAGMLRSFSYAAAFALRRHAEAPAGEHATVEPHLEGWERETAAAFLDTYRETIGDCVSYPRDAEQARRLIALFTLEKALYELRYEINNRPDWIAVPLGALVRLAQVITANGADQVSDHNDPAVKTADQDNV